MFLHLWIRLLNNVRHIVSKTFSWKRQTIQGHIFCQTYLFAGHEQEHTLNVKFLKVLYLIELISSPFLLMSLKTGLRGLKGLSILTDRVYEWSGVTVERQYLGKQTFDTVVRGREALFFCGNDEFNFVNMNIFIWVQYLNWELHILHNPRYSSFVGCCSYLLRTLFLVEVSSGKFLPVSQSQKAGTARHSRLMKRRSLTCTTWGLTIPGHTDCSTIRLHG